MSRLVDLGSVRLPQAVGSRSVSLAGPVFAAGLALAIGARLVMIAILTPGSDVFYYDQQAAQALLSGANPYTHTFTGVPPSLVTPGAERVFAYLPFTALYLIPFYLLGDVRFGFLAADAIIGFSLYKLGGRWGLLSSLVFLLTPFTMIFSTLYLNNSLISMAFLALFLLFERRGNRLGSSLALGVSLASVQLVWILFPFLAYYLVRNTRGKDLAVSVLVATVLMVPFALWSFPDFVSETIVFQFVRPTLAVITHTGALSYILNLSLNGLLVALAGFALPLHVRVGAMLILLPLFLRKTGTFRDLLLYGGIFILISVFILPNDFFWAYTELPFLVLLAQFAVGRSLPQPQRLILEGENRPE